MSQEPLKDVETKILDFLSKADEPKPASQIAAYICETPENTFQGIERLIKKGLVKGENSLAYLRRTGEVIVFTLTDRK